MSNQAALQTTLESLGYYDEKAHPEYKGMSFEERLQTAVKDVMEVAGVKGDEYTQATGQQLMQELPQVGITSLSSEQIDRFSPHMSTVLEMQKNPGEFVGKLDGYLDETKQNSLNLNGVQSTVAPAATSAAGASMSVGGMMVGLMGWMNDNLNSGGFAGVMSNMLKGVLGFIEPLLKSMTGMSLTEMFGKVAAPAGVAATASLTKGFNEKADQPASQTPAPTDPAVNVAPGSVPNSLDFNARDLDSVDYGAEVQCEFDSQYPDKIESSGFISGGDPYFELPDELTIYSIEKDADGNFVQNEVGSGITPEQMKEEFPDGFSITMVTEQDADSSVENSHVIGYQIKGMNADGQPRSFYVAPNAFGDSQSDEFKEESRQELETDLGTPGDPGMDNDPSMDKSPHFALGA